MYNLIKHYNHADVPQKYVQVLFIILLRRVSKTKTKINGNSTIPQILSRYLPTYSQCWITCKIYDPVYSIFRVFRQISTFRIKTILRILRRRKNGFLSLGQKLPKLFWYQVDVERNDEWVKVELARFFLPSVVLDGT